MYLIAFHYVPPFCCRGGDIVKEIPLFQYCFTHCFNIWIFVMLSEKSECVSCVVLSGCRKQGARDVISAGWAVQHRGLAQCGQEMGLRSFLQGHPRSVGGGVWFVKKKFLKMVKMVPVFKKLKQRTFPRYCSRNYAISTVAISTVDNFNLSQFRPKLILATSYS